MTEFIDAQEYLWKELHDGLYSDPNIFLEQDHSIVPKSDVYLVEFVDESGEVVRTGVWTTAPRVVMKEMVKGIPVEYLQNMHPSVWNPDSELKPLEEYEVREVARREIHWTLQNMWTSLDVSKDIVNPPVSMKWQNLKQGYIYTVTLIRYKRKFVEV